MLTRLDGQPGNTTGTLRCRCRSGGGGPSFCNGTFDPSITNALGWAAVIDHRFAVDNINEWGYWWFIIPAAINSGEGLMTDTGVVPLRTYVIGQYSRFIRPGYYRIDATHVPQTGISVSAYQNTSGGNLVIVATNYTASPISQTFNLNKCASLYERDAVHHIGYARYSIASGPAGLKQLVYLYASGGQRHYVCGHDIPDFNRSNCPDKSASSDRLRGYSCASKLGAISPRLRIGTQTMVSFAEDIDGN